MRTIYAFGLLGVLGLVVAGATGAAQAVPLVQNGNFTTTSNSVSDEFGNQWSGQTVSNWTADGYTFIYLPPDFNADGSCGNNCVALYTPATTADTLSGGGGNFVATDPVFIVKPFDLTQMISGLSMGSTYALSFDYAGAQQVGYNGQTTEGWTGSIGSSTFTTPTLTDPSNGFTGWVNYVFNFTATSGSELLTFIATGGPDNTEPPFALLDNVSINQTTTRVPEPMTLALFGAGLFGAVVLRRRKKVKMV